MPKLQRQPVVVLSNNDGCIVARSNEAKIMGIGMGEPFFKFREVIEHQNVRVFSSNYALYGDMSRRVMTILGAFAPDIEIYSIDESFLDLSGCDHLSGHKTLTDYSRTIRAKVLRWTGIPVSIGIARTKTLAKIAGRIAKKSEKTNGVVNLVDSHYIDRALDKVYVWDVWGVGRRHGKRFAEKGIVTARQLRDMNENVIRKQMGILGVRLLQELRGISCLPLTTVTPPRKGIVSSRSFGRKVSSLTELQEAVAAYVTNAAVKLRNQNSAAKLLSVFLMTNHFNKQDKQYSNKVTMKLPMATNNTSELIRYATRGLKRIFRERYSYKKAGIMLNDLVPADQIQMNLFDYSNIEKNKTLMKTIDRINGKLGSDAVKFATQGFTQPWKMKSDLRSNRYTTNWDELPDVTVEQQ